MTKKFYSLENYNKLKFNKLYQTMYIKYLQFCGKNVNKKKIQSFLKTILNLNDFYFIYVSYFWVEGIE